MTHQIEYFPDGTVIDDWFYDIQIPTLEELGKPYVLTDYHIFDDGKVYTKEIQHLIDIAAIIRLWKQESRVRPVSIFLDLLMQMVSMAL